MISYSLFISFFLGVIFPGVLLPIFPEVLHNKDLEEGIGYLSIIYLSILFVMFSIMIYINRKSELIFLKNSKDMISENKVLAVFFIIMLYAGRISYMLYISDSPYKMLVENEDMLVYGIFNKLVNYFYITVNFKLYTLFQGIIILSLPRKYLPLFFIGEFAYAGIIYSKFIIFINLIAIVLLYIHYKELWNNKKGIIYLFFAGFFSLLLLFVLREVFGQLRQGEFLLSSVDYRSVITDGLSRIQSLISVFYAEKVLNEWFYGKTLCHVVGYLIPDSLIQLPINCKNIDEPILIYYYGLSELSLIEKDMLSLWGEPFANFGIFGILLFVLLILLVKLLTNKLGTNKYGLIFSWFVFITCLVSHTSWSAIIGNIYLSFIFLWIVQFTENYFYKKRRSEIS